MAGNFEPLTILPFKMHAAGSQRPDEHLYDLPTPYETGPANPYDMPNGDNHANGHVPRDDPEEGLPNGSGPRSLKAKKAGPVYGEARADCV